MNTAYMIAKNLVGMKELPGDQDEYFIQWCLKLCHIPEPIHDEIAWCSAGMNGVHFLAGLTCTYSAMARSWLLIGKAIPLAEAKIGDIVILKRGGTDEPGPEVQNAPGHVAFFEGLSVEQIRLYGANQSNSWSVGWFSRERVLGVRRV